jgi:hypothetical protein
VEPTEPKEFSYTVSYTATALYAGFEEPTASTLPDESIPVAAFAHASTLQAAVRYLIDTRKLRTTDAAALLGRNVKTVSASYRQVGPLPRLSPDEERSLPIPVRIFRQGLPPLEALVLHLKSIGVRNVAIAALLRLDPRTTWTAAKRGEGRR